MLDKSADLDGDYAAFGWVTSGMNIIEEISKDITKADYMNSSGFLYEYAQPIIESVTIIE
jgi:peptidyl-prolyl cis-trans isomerase B (cyclophilin B)